MAGHSVFLTQAFPWAGMLLQLTAQGTGSSYIPALFATSGAVNIILLRLRLATPLVAFAIMALPTLHLLQLSNDVLGLVQPIMGRLGVIIPGDSIIAAVVGTATCLAGGAFLAPLHAKGARTSPRLLLVMCIPGLLYGLLIAVPFSASTPKRLIVQHVSRTVNGEPMDSGIWYVQQTLLLFRSYFL